MAYGKGKSENRESAGKSDVSKGRQEGSKSVSSGVEKVGGPTGVRFPVHNHPEHCNVNGPKGTMDK